MTHLLVQSTYCHSLYYFPCHMRYETWAPSSTMTMDELKLLSIPSEMLRFFNHFSFPHKGRPTRSMHPSYGHTQHTTYERGHKQVPMTMDQLKSLSISSEMLRFFNHTCPSRMGHLTRSMHFPPMNIHNMHMLMHFQHQSTFHFHIILNIDIISSQ